MKRHRQEKRRTTGLPIYWYECGHFENVLCRFVVIMIKGMCPPS